jgi:ribose transport system substrate-binding protein
MGGQKEKNMKMKIKRTLSIGTAMGATMLSLTLVPYAASASVRPATTVDASLAQPHWVIHGTIGPYSDAFWTTMACGGMQEAKTLGVSLTWYSDTAAIGAAQIAERVQAAGLGNPNGIILTPQGAINNNPYLAAWAKKHIPVIETNDIVGSPFYQIIESKEDNPAVVAMADVIAKQTGGTGTVGILVVEPGIPQVVYRYKPLISELHRVAPNLNVLGIQYDQGSVSVSETIAAAEIVAHPDMKAIYATSGQEVVGAATAVKAAGKAGKIGVYGYDAEPNEVALLKQGLVFGLIAQSPYLVGALSVQHMVTLLNSRITNPNAPVGQGTPFDYYTPTKILTPANINTPAAAHFVYSTSCS